MKTIGFIDYYLDEWHANNYPAWFRESSFRSQMDVRHAWAQKDNAAGISNAAWAARHGVELLDSPGDVVERSDFLIVLAPDNPERHEALSALPLESGKPVYIDKPFAPGLQAGMRMVRKARECRTPFFSSSALRFAGELGTLRKSIGEKPLHYLSTGGGNAFALYAIHQIEMLVAFVGCPAERLMQCGLAGAPHIVIDFESGTRASMEVLPGASFRISAVFGDGETFHAAPLDGGFFAGLIEAIGMFFISGEIPFATQETLFASAIFDAAVRALEKPFAWIEVGQLPEDLREGAAAFPHV